MYQLLLEMPFKNRSPLAMTAAFKKCGMYFFHRCISGKGSSGTNQPHSLPRKIQQAEGNSHTQMYIQQTSSSAINFMNEHEAPILSDISHPTFQSLGNMRRYTKAKLRKTNLPVRRKGTSFIASDSRKTRRKLKAIT